MCVCEVLYTGCSAVDHVYLTTALNLFWVLLAASVFGVLILGHTGHGPCLPRRGAWRRFFAVAITVLALFPCISVSDDLAGFARLNPGRQPDSSAVDPVSVQFASLLQSLEQIQVSEVFTLVLSLFFLELVTLSCYEFRGLLLPALQGRAPPLA